MKQTRVNKYIKTLKPKRLRQQAAAIYHFYLKHTPPEKIRIFALKIVMNPINYDIKNYLWGELIKKHGEGNMKVLADTLADLADGKKRIRKRK